MSMKGWFNYIIYENLNAKKRQLPFYPDFRFKDKFKYYLKFDTNIEVLNKDDFEIEIQNSMGRFKTEIKKVQPNVVLLETYFLVNKEEIPPENVVEVEDIYIAIEKLNKGVLEIQTLK